VPHSTSRDSSGILFWRIRFIVFFCCGYAKKDTSAWPVLMIGFDKISLGFLKNIIAGYAM
jgi:hypothetical protein